MDRRIIFSVVEQDVVAALEAMDVKLDMGRLEEACRFVGDRYDNLAPQEVMDAVCDFLDLKEID